MRSLTVNVKLRDRNTWIHKIITRYLLKKKGVDAGCKFYTKRIQIKIGGGEWQRYYDMPGVKNGEFVLVDEDEENEE